MLGQGAYLMQKALSRACNAASELKRPCRVGDWWGFEWHMIQ